MKILFIALNHQCQPGHNEILEMNHLPRVGEFLCIGNEYTSTYQIMSIFHLYDRPSCTDDDDVLIDVEMVGFEVDNLAGRIPSDDFKPAIHHEELGQRRKYIIELHKIKNSPEPKLKLVPNTTNNQEPLK